MTRGQSRSSVRQQEPDLRDLVAEAPLLLFAFDTRGTITAAGGKGFAELNLSPEAWVGRPAHELFPETPQLAKDLQRALAGNAFTSIVRRGEALYELRFSPYPAGQQGATSVICVGLDVSGRARAAGALRESENRFRKAFSHAGIGMALLGIDGRFLQANRMLVSLLGVNEAALRAKTLQEVLHPEEVEALGDWLADLISGHSEAQHVETRFLTRAGTPTWVQLSLSLVRDDLGNPLHLLVLVQDISDRKRAEQALQQYAERLKIFRQIDQAILAARSPREIATAVVRQVRALIPCQRVSVTLFDLQAQTAHQLAADVSQADSVVVENHFDLSSSVEEALRGGGVHIVEDIQALPQPRPIEQNLLAQGIRTYINVPLLVAGDLVGSLNLGAHDPGAFSSEHIELALEVADPLAVAIQQARLHMQVQHHAAELERRVTELRASERYLALLNDITHSAIGVHDFDELLQLLADRMGDLFDADGCFITLWDETRQTTIPAAAYGPLSETYRQSGAVSDKQTMTASVLQAGKALIAEEVHNSPYISPEITRAFPTQSLLGLPLIAGEQKLGAALIAFDQPHQFTEDEIIRGEQAAAQIALAIAKAQLLEAEKQRRQEAETLRAVANALASTLDLQQVLDLILDELARVIDYDSASVMLWDGDSLVAMAGRGFKDQQEVVGRRFPADDALFTAIRQAGRAIWLDDPKNDPRFHGWGDTGDIRSWIGLPLLVRGKFIGHMTLDSYRPNAYGEAEAALVQPFANQAAQAIENARLFDWVQRQAVTDSLTGLYNRRGLFELGQREVERAYRFERALTAIMLDIDHFKRVNDRYGHSTGDQVLCEIARRCTQTLRKVDLLARYGGEEFAVLLPETELSAAVEIAERLRECIAGRPFTTDRAYLPITISLGVAQIPAARVDLAYLLDAADTAMYAAKQAGRNCVRATMQEGNVNETASAP